MQKTNKVRGMIAMTAVVLIYGVSYLAREAIGSDLAPAQTLSLQMIIMCAFFGIYSLVTHKSFKLQKKDIVWVLASGLFGTALFHGFTLLSVNAVGATVSSLLYGFAAAFALLVEVVVYKRKKTVLGLVSIVLSVLGIVVLMARDLKDLANANLIGYLLGLGSVVSWVTYTFLCDKISGDYEKPVLLTYQALVGVVCTVPLMLVGGHSFAGLAIPKVLGAVLFLGLFNSAIAYFLNMYAIKNIGVTLSNLFLNFLPVVTIILNIILNGVMPNVYQIIGAILILISVFVLNKDEQNLANQKAAENSKEN